MQRIARQRRRRAALLAASVGLHAVLLGLLAIGGAAVTYRTFNDPAALEIDLMRPPLPKMRQATADRSPAQESPIHPRPLPQQPIPPTVTPSPIPAAPPGLRSGSGGNGSTIGQANHPGPLPPGPKENVRGALRSSVFACANADAVGLNRQERDRCDEKVGAIGLAATAQRADIDPNKRRDWDYDAARAEARRRQRGSQPIGQGVDTSSGPEAKPIPW